MPSQLAGPAAPDHLVAGSDLTGGVRVGEYPCIPVRARVSVKLPLHLSGELDTAWVAAHRRAGRTAPLVHRCAVRAGMGA